MRTPALITLFLLSVIITDGQRIGFPGDYGPASLLKQTRDKKLTDSVRVSSFLQLADYYMSKEGYTNQNLDSAYLFIQQAAALSSKYSDRKTGGLFLLYQSKLLRKKENTDSARALVRQAIQQLFLRKDTFQLIPAFFQLSRCYNADIRGSDRMVKNAFDTAFQLIKNHPKQSGPETIVRELRLFYQDEVWSDSKLMQIYFLNGLLGVCRLTNQKVDEFYTRTQILDIHYQNGEFRNAITGLLAIAEEQKAGGYPELCFTYDLLSGIYHADGNFDRALFYSLKAVSNVRTAYDSSYLSNFYSRVSENYRITGSEEDALNWSLKRLNYLVSAKQSQGQITALHEVSYSLVKLGRPKEALALLLEKSKGLVAAGYYEKRDMLTSFASSYAALKNYKLAEKYCDELIREKDLMVKQKNITDDFSSDLALSWIYLDMGQFDKAEKYYNLFLSEIGPMRGYADAIYETTFIYKLDSARGNYLAAMGHLQDLQKVRDSLFSVTKTKQIEELKIAYDTEQKDSLINLKEQNIQLLTKQDQLQKSKLQQGNVLRNISYTAIGLLIIIMSLLYNRYRLKQRTNRQLEVQQTEIASQNNSLKHLVNEKDWLVKEIHHRVKNNFQTVMGLLGTQSAYLKNDIAINAINDSQRRIQSMSLIHQRLYQSNNLSAINMKDYIHELVNSLSESFNTSGHVRFYFDIEPIELDLAHCIPLGLILNEAITNSFKYAFKNKQPGEIHISLQRSAAEDFLLTIRDNGIGLPYEFDTGQTHSMGMNLMRGLCAEIGAQFTIFSEEGTVVSINFTYAPENATEYTPSLYEAINLS